MNELSRVSTEYKTVNQNWFQDEWAEPIGSEDVKRTMRILQINSQSATLPDHDLLAKPWMPSTSSSEWISLFISPIVLTISLGKYYKLRWDTNDENK